MTTIRLDRRSIPQAAAFSIWPAPDGWSLRRFDWPSAAGEARGSLLFVGGLADFAEKNLEAFAHWHRRGWSVASFDWRGQGGSGRLAASPHVAHAADFAIHVEDIAAFWRQWRNDAAGPRVLVGHSMGGHLALRAMVEGAIHPDAAVLVAPMLGLHSPVGARLGEMVARGIVRVGGAERRAWKADKPAPLRFARKALLTSDHDRYSDELWWHEQRPALRAGPPSWGWVAAAFRSTNRLAGDPRLGKLDIPTLMLVADADRLVRAGAALAIATRLPDAELLRFGTESAHEILREHDPVRDRAFAAIDGFLDTRVPR